MDDSKEIIIYLSNLYDLLKDEIGNETVEVSIHYLRKLTFFCLNYKGNK